VRKDSLLLKEHLFHFVLVLTFLILLMIEHGQAAAADVATICKIAPSVHPEAKRVKLVSCPFFKFHSNIFSN
jgi:hypothetical protein